jgi:hypothetical protein
MEPRLLTADDSCYMYDMYMCMYWNFISFG